MLGFSKLGEKGSRMWRHQAFREPRGSESFQRSVAEHFRLTLANRGLRLTHTHTHTHPPRHKARIYGTTRLGCFAFKAEGTPRLSRQDLQGKKKCLRRCVCVSLSLRTQYFTAVLQFRVTGPDTAIAGPAGGVRKEKICGPVKSWHGEPSKSTKTTQTATLVPAVDGIWQVMWTTALTTLSS